VSLASLVTALTSPRLMLTSRKDSGRLGRLKMSSASSSGRGEAIQSDRGVVVRGERPLKSRHELLVLFQHRC
jgi:hypothetical protein